MSLLAAGASAAGNILGSVALSAMGYYMSKHMAKYNYDLLKRGYKEFPSAQVEGLRAAGINPLLAYNGIAGATSHAGNYQASPGSDLGSSALNNYREGKKINSAVKNLEADTEAKLAQGNAAEGQAAAALINAKTNAKRVNAEISLMQSKDPTETGWGVTDKILGYTGDIGTAVGGTALGAKAIYDVMKKPKPETKTIIDKNGTKHRVKKLPSGLLVPEGTSKVKKSSDFSKVINSAKGAFPILFMLGKGAAAAGATYGAAKYGTKANKANHLNKRVNKEMKEKGKDSLHSFFDPGFGF